MISRVCHVSSPRPSCWGWRAPLLLLVSVVVVSRPRAAVASENYPAIIDRQKGVECPRPLTRCLICHDTAAGGEQTANQPFALALRMDYGLSGGKAGRELAAALQALPDDVDTDLDGAPDQEELANCGNPSGEELSEGPGFGCNAAPLGPARSGPTPPGLASLGMAVLWLLHAARVHRSRAARESPGREQLEDSTRERGASKRRPLGPERALPVCAMLLLSTCAPTEIAEERFQSRSQTCYEFPVAPDAGAPVQDSFWSGARRREGCAAVTSSGVGGSIQPGAPARLGGDASSAGAASGGAGGQRPGVPTPPAPSAADAGGEASSADAEGMNDTPLPPGCDEREILEGFSQPYDRGGCTDPGGTGCHEGGTGEAPILADPGLTVSRLLDAEDPEGCGQTWIPRGATRPEESFLWRRLTENVSDDDCETRMPLEEPALDPVALECIGAWIVWVANGGRP